MKEVYEKALLVVLEKIRSFYGDRLVSVVVFGSVGRGTPNPESDIDILVVVRNLPSGVRKRQLEFMDLEKEIEPFLKGLNKEGLHLELSPILKTPEEVKKGSLLFLDFLEDARILYDENDFFRLFLVELKKRLEKLGAKRIKQGDRWHWDLKPDLKPGEVFEI